ncbi:MAG: FKBP-type peptidyl-prolyl cis-trans isomerase [Breznakibacter sp.]
MKIDRNKFVTLSYELRINGVDGELIEKTEAENPLEFVFGAGKMLEMFENKIEGLKTGDQFSFELKADEAYGDVDPDAVVDLPKNIFEVDGAIADGLLSIGNQVPMMDAHGNRLNGIVVDVADDSVKMDFNHPLAGDDLHFTGSVLEVREATEDEMSDACGCGDSCGSGDCSSDGCGCGCGC